MPDAAFTLSGLGAGTTTVSTDGFDAAALLKNTGTNPAYASPVPITDAGQGFPIDPGGGTLAWPQGRPLYLIAPAGTTTVVIDPGNGDSSTTSPTELANAIVGAGLAQDIANQISLKGVPIIDDPQILSDGVFSAAPANAPYDYAWSVGSPFFGQPTIDVSAFQSLTIAFLANIPGATTENMVWTVQFFSDAAGTKSEGQYVGEMMLSGSMNATIPCSGRYVAVTLGWQGGQISSAPSFFFTLTGSYRSVPEYRYWVLNDLWENLSYRSSTSQCGNSAMKYPIPTSATPAYFFPSYTNLPMQICAYNAHASSTQPLNVTVSDLSTNFLGGIDPLTSNGFNNASVYLASTQPKVAIVNINAANFSGSSLYLNMSFQRS